MNTQEQKKDVTAPDKVYLIGLLTEAEQANPLLMTQINETRQRMNDVIEMANATVERANKSERVLAVLIGRIATHTHDAAGRAVIPIELLS